MIDYQEAFPGRPPTVLEVARQLDALVRRLFSEADVTVDAENVGFGFGTGYRGLVFVITPQRTHVNLGVALGASLPDPAGLMQGAGKVHHHVKLRRVEEVDDPRLETLMRTALAAARERVGVT